MERHRLRQRRGRPRRAGSGQVTGGGWSPSGRGERDGDDQTPPPSGSAWAAGAHLGPECFVFSPDPDGLRPRNPDWASTEWRRATRRAARYAGIEGLERVRLYDVRHFFATRLLAAGVKEVEIAQVMGNSPSTMRYHYASAISLGGREAAGVMDELLGGPPGSPPRRARRA